MEWSANRQLILYMTIALLTALQGQLIQIQGGELTLNNPTNLSLFAVNLILPSLITLKAFLNQDLSKKKS